MGGWSFGRLRLPAIITHLKLLLVLEVGDYEFLAFFGDSSTMELASSTLAGTVHQNEVD
jgi:hypothetical protein